jgi:hypothetical protein
MRMPSPWAFCAVLTACAAAPAGCGDIIGDAPVRIIPDDDAAAPSAAHDDTAAHGAAHDLATAFCDRAQACAPAYVTFVWGDVPHCTSRMATVFEQNIVVDASGWDVDTAESCAQSVPGLSCADALAGNVPSCLGVHGKLASGATCASSAQCADGLCRKPAGSTCGACTEIGSAGSTCTGDFDCGDGTTCTSGVCARVGMQGAACDASRPCVLGLACVAGTCNTPLPAGAACQELAECDQLHGLACLSKTCKSVSFAAANEPCGVVGNGIILCQGPGAHCRTPSVISPTAQGTCVPHAEDGAACDATIGPLCDFGSRCQNGVCVFPDATKCR